MGASSDGGGPAVDHADRQVLKATHVPLRVQVPREGGAITKFGFVRNLGLQAGEVNEVRKSLANAAAGQTQGLTPRSGVWKLLGQFEGSPMPSLLPAPSTFAAVDASALSAFGAALIDLRKQRLAALSGGAPSPSELTTLDAGAASLIGLAQAMLNKSVIAGAGFLVNVEATPIGMLNLERIEMVPAGLERGELLATIPLAPLEETSVVQKEWSVTSKEFTSIVTDSLENYSETGVTDNTELAQSTASQIQHSTQLNITGTVQGGIPLISGSTTATFGAQDATSLSATESRKHAVELTSKASSRSKQEHKVTISTTTQSGQSLTTTRTLKNQSATDPMRVDYFSLLRKWRVRLYRYGLRLTYDVVVPEPGAALREAYAKLDRLRGQLGPFTFPYQHSDISTLLVDHNGYPSPIGVPKYQWLADRFGAKVPPPPAALAPVTVTQDLGGPSGGRGNYYVVVPFDVPGGYEITEITMVLHVNANTGVHHGVEVLGTDFVKPAPQDDQTYPPAVLGNRAAPGNFLAGATGRQELGFVFVDANAAIVELMIGLEPTPQSFDQWRSDVWSILYDAAQNQYYSQQQDINGQIADLTDQLQNIDTLTLRREENDEIMKSVLRWLLGANFDFMPAPVINAIVDSGADVVHGVGFTGNSLGLDSADWAIVSQHEDEIRFINQAIEWENVVAFLYSYFWDVPQSWDFIRQIKHPDSTRQAFLRAGSARVVLTVRKGWEEAWVQFVEGGFHGASLSSGHPYLTIAQEIAAYDDRNYPGIPPANPGETAVAIEDAVYTTSSAKVSPDPAGNPITIPVASSAGFVVGQRVVIDVFDSSSLQEAQQITAIPDATHLTVAKLDNDHDGTGTAFPVLQPGEKGALIAEWNEYTPSSGTDIAIQSDLSKIA